MKKRNCGAIKRIMIKADSKSSSIVKTIKKMRQARTRKTKKLEIERLTAPFLLQPVS
jgi:hypothetical protein